MTRTSDKRQDPTVALTLEPFALSRKCNPSLSHKIKKKKAQKTNRSRKETNTKIRRYEETTIDAMKIIYPAIISAAVLAVFSSLAAAQEFIAISDDVPQDVSRVHLSDNCPTGHSGFRTRAMMTILPNDDGSGKVKIITFPQDLVTAKKSRNSQLELEFNPDVAFDVNEGGIQIFFPPDQLQAVSVAADAETQIFDGFTSITSISVSSDAKLQANLVSLTNNSSNVDEYDLEVSVSSDARATIISSAPLKKLDVSSDGYVQLQAPSIAKLSVSSDGVAEINGDILTEAKISSDATVTIDGDLSGEASISSDATVTIYGSVAGTVQVSSDGELNVGNGITGTVRASSDADVNAPSCDNVSTNSGADCDVEDDIEGQVTVTVETKSLTLEGTEHCGNLLDGLATGLIVAITLSSLAIFIVGIVLCCCCCCGGCGNSSRRDGNYQEKKFDGAGAGSEPVVATDAVAHAVDVNENGRQNDPEAVAVPY